MVESVVKCIEAQTNEMFKGGVDSVRYDEPMDKVVMDLSKNIAEIKDSLVKNLFTSAVKKFVEKHFPFLKCDFIGDNSLIFTKSLWV